MDRRSFLKGIAAAAVLPAMPATVVPSLDDLECIVEWSFKLYRPEYMIVTLKTEE